MPAIIRDAARLTRNAKRNRNRTGRPRQFGLEAPLGSWDEQRGMFNDTHLCPRRTSGPFWRQFYFGRSGNEFTTRIAALTRKARLSSSKTQRESAAIDLERMFLRNLRSMIATAISYRG